MATDVLSLPPTADTKTHVIAIYNDRPHFACARCSAIIVSTSLPLSRIHTAHLPITHRSLKHTQSLQDELISKSFSGREGRGLYVAFPPLSSSSQMHTLT